MKYDLSDCSVVVPFSIDCKERLEHLEFLLFFFDRHFVNHKLIVVEHGKESKISSRPNLFVKFIKIETPFSPGSVTNRGVEEVETSFFCRFDVDALIDPRAIFDALELLKRSPELSMLLPYNGVSFTIKDPLRMEIMQSCDLKKLPFLKKEELVMWKREDLCVKNGSATGLIYFFRTDTFKQLGGFNEEFIGWGYEDEEIIARYRQMKRPAKYLENYNAFHLDHPRIPGDSRQAAKNQFLSHIVARMDEEDLLSYIKTWNRLS